MIQKNKKTYVFIIIGIIIIVALFMIFKSNQTKKDVKEEAVQTAEYTEELEDGTKINTSEKLSENKAINGFEFKNIQLTYINGTSVLLADVTNKTGNDTHDVTAVEVTVLDKQEKTLATLTGLVAPLKNGENTQISIGVTSDIANAYDFKMKVKD